MSTAASVRVDDITSSSEPFRTSRSGRRIRPPQKSNRKRARTDQTSAERSDTEEYVPQNATSRVENGVSAVDDDDERTLAAAEADVSAEDELEELRALAEEAHLDLDSLRSAMADTPYDDDDDAGDDNDDSDSDYQGDHAADVNAVDVNDLPRQADVIRGRAPPPPVRSSIPTIQATTTLQNVRSSIAVAALPTALQEATAMPSVFPSAAAIADTQTDTDTDTAARAFDPQTADELEALRRELAAFEEAGDDEEANDDDSDDGALQEDDDDDDDDDGGGGNDSESSDYVPPPIPSLYPPRSSRVGDAFKQTLLNDSARTNKTPIAYARPQRIATDFALTPLTISTRRHRSSLSTNNDAQTRK